MTPARDIWEPVASEQGFLQVDCREYMKKNPDTVARKGHTAEHDDVQTSVFEQDGFATVMKWCLEEVWANPKVSLKCNHAIHRAPSCGLFLESALNSVVDRDGKRIFNAMHFNMGGLQAKDIKVVMNRAREWHNEAWALQPTIARGNIFGERAARMSKEAWQNWAECVTVIDGWSGGSNAASAGAVTAATADAPGAAASSGPQTERPAKRPRPPAASPVAGEQPTYASADRDVPEWATFEPKAESWRAFLVEQGVDVVSQQELFLLAALSTDGWYAANSVLAKLAKKTADGEQVRNVSAFVHACVQNARRSIPHGWFPPAEGKGSK